jgi:rod shape-determining protein MreD
MLVLAFFLSLLAWILQGVLIPKLSLLAFSPFLAYAILLKRFHKALLWATAAGCLVDLTSQDPMGLHALNYVLTTALLHKIKSPFSAEQTLHVSCLTGLVSFLSTVLQLVLLFLFEQRIPFDFWGTTLDLFAMPFLDAFYGFVWLVAPLTLFRFLQKKWKFYRQQRQT